MKMKLLNLIAGAIAAVFAVGCGPTVQEILDQHERDLNAGTMENTLKLLQKEAEDEDNDQLLWRLMAGNVSSLLNDPEEGIRQFDGAEDIFSKNDKESVFAKGSDGTMSILNNEKSFPYNGIGQDRLFCCFYKAIDYAELGKMDSSRTELNRAMEHQENWLFERRKEIANAEEALEKAAQAKEKEKPLDGNDRSKNVAGVLANNSFKDILVKHCGFDMSKSGDLAKMTPADYQNAYMTHFCGIFRYLNGDNGRDFLRNAVTLKPANQTAKADFASFEAGKMPSNDVWIYMEDGLCANRKEVRFDLPAFLIPYANRYVLYAGMAFPALVSRSAGANLYTVKVGGTDYAMEELESIDRLVKVEYDVYMHNAVKREITRCLVKVAAQVALGIAAENVSDQYARMGLKAGQIAAAAWARATTAADTRCWASLPKRVFVAHIQRPADGKIVMTADGKPVEITVPAGNSIVWMRKAAPLAPIRMKVLNFPQK